jgi:hypothetical protein
MIEKLMSRLIQDNFGTIYGSNPPTSTEITNKINEIIDYLNKLEEKKEDAG